MPEIEKEKLDAMLREVPEEKRDAFLTDFKSRGYTLKGSQPQRADANTLAGQKPIYQPEDQQSKPQMAWQALKGSLNSDIPVAGPAVGAMRNQIPNWIAEKSGQMGQRLGGTAGNAVQNVGLAAGTAIGTAGEFLPKSMGELVATLATMSPTLQGVAGKALAPVGRAINTTGEVLADFAANLSGADPEALKAVFKNPKIAAKFGEKLNEWDQANLVNKVQDSLKSVGKRFEQIQDGLAGFGALDRKAIMKVDMKPAFQNTVKSMLESGHTLPSDLSGIKQGLRVGKLDPNSVDYKTVISKLGELKKFGEKGMDFGEALNFKRQLDQAINYGVEGQQGLQKLSGEGNRVLKTMRTWVDSQMRQSLPTGTRTEWDAANKAYQRARMGYDQLRKEVVGQTPQQTVMRVMRQIRTGRAESGLHEKAAMIGKEAEKALMDIHDRVVASQFKKYVKSGGSGAWSIVTGTSPRLIARGTAAAGIAKQGMDQAAEKILAHPTMLAQSIQALLRNYGENSSNQ